MLIFLNTSEKLCARVRHLLKWANPVTLEVTGFFLQTPMTSWVHYTKQSAEGEVGYDNR